MSLEVPPLPTDPVAPSAYSKAEPAAVRGCIRAPDAQHADTTSRRTYGLLLGSHFLAALGFSMFSLLPKYLLTARGATQADIGPSTMALPLGSLLCAPLVAWSMARVPKAHIMRVGAVVFALVAGLCASSPAVALLPPLALLAGAAVMAVFGAGSALMSDVAPQANMARALGLHGAAGMVGHALGPSLLEPLARQYGWNAAFACAGIATLSASLMPLPVGAPLPRLATSPSVFPVLIKVLTVSALVGVMHNALWVSHQPLVLARGGRDMASYFFGMSVGGIVMRVAFGGLPDRLGIARSARVSLAMYVFATAAMTFVTPALLGVLGLVHGLAHGVFYPAMGALCTARVSAQGRGHALTMLYASFNGGATLASFAFARLGQACGPASVFPVASLFGVLAFGVLLDRRAQAVAKAA